MKRIKEIIKREAELSIIAAEEEQKTIVNWQYLLSPKSHRFARLDFRYHWLALKIEVLKILA